MQSDPEGALLQLAARQHSVFSRGQALDLGVTGRTIQRRVASGRWRSLHRGIYASASTKPCWRQGVMAACLACGPRAFASHRSAAAVWDLVEEVQIPDVTVPLAVVRSHPGIAVHRTLRIERARHQGFPVSTPMRTLLDLAGSESVELVERALDTAHRRRLISLERLASYMARPEHVSLGGAGELRRMIAVRDPDKPVDSDMESLFLSAVRRAGLPIPMPQYEVRTRNGDRFIDFAYPEHKVAIELDGFEGHGHPRAFDADRARQNELEELGWHVFRFTWSQVTSGSSAFLLTVGAAIGLEPSRWRRKSGRQRFNAGRSALRSAAL